MTKREAAIVTAYTGFLIGDFSDAHQYIEELMGAAVFTHQMGGIETMAEIARRAKKDFIALEITND